MAEQDKIVGKTADECLEEIFAENRSNDNAWKIKKSRFKKGELPEHGKQALLAEFGYVQNKEATYIRKKNWRSKKK